MAAKNADKATARALHEKRMAFGRCAELYIEVHRSGWKNPKHAAQWSATLTTYCAPIWKLPIDTIDTALVMKCLDPIWMTKTETASQLRGRIESVLAWATVRMGARVLELQRLGGHGEKLMSLSDRVAKLERDASPIEALRLVYVAVGADKAAEHDRQRQQEGYQGALAVLDEVDRQL